MKNHSPSDQTREKKRAQFSEVPKARSKALPITAVVMLALVAVAAYFGIGSLSDKPAATTVTGTNQAGAGDVRIPLAELEGGKAKFFDYTLSNNKSIRFFAIRSSDGEYRAALDACDTCYHAKKGYRQQGDDMVCNNCGLKFNSTGINIAKGGCNPVGLARVIEGDHLVIKASELEDGGKYF